MRHAIFLLTLMALLLGSCCRQAAVTADHSAQHEVHDTTIIHESGGLIYVPYTVPADTLRVSVPVDCDSLGRVKAAQLSATGHRTWAQTALRTDSTGGQFISVVLGCAALQDSLAVAQRTIEHITWQRDSVATARSQTIIVPQVPDFYKWCTTGFWSLLIILLIAAGLYLYFKLK